MKSKTRLANILWWNCYAHTTTLLEYKGLDDTESDEIAVHICDRARELYLEDFNNRVGSDMTHFPNLILIIEDDILYADSWLAPYTDKIIDNLREAEIPIFLMETFPDLVGHGKMWQVSCYGGFGVDDYEFPEEIILDIAEWKIREVTDENSISSI